MWNRSGGLQGAGAAVTGYTTTTGIRTGKIVEVAEGADGSGETWIETATEIVTMTTSTAAWPLASSPLTKSLAR